MGHGDAGFFFMHGRHSLLCLFVRSRSAIAILEKSTFQRYDTPVSQLFYFYINIKHNNYLASNWTRSNTKPRSSNKAFHPRLWQMRLLDKGNTLHGQPIKTLGGLVGSWRSAVMDNISPKCRRFDSVPGDVLFFDLFLDVFWIDSHESANPICGSLFFFTLFILFQFQLQNEGLHLQIPTMSYNLHPESHSQQIPKRKKKKRPHRENHTSPLSYQKPPPHIFPYGNNYPISTSRYKPLPAKTPRDWSLFVPLSLLSPDGTYGESFDIFASPCLLRVSAPCIGSGPFSSSDTAISRHD
ncbi:hypothetical protein GGI35DRAFT_181222 [Trichoderma velutinum]